MFRPLRNLNFSREELALIQQLLQIDEPWDGPIGATLPRGSSKLREKLKKEILDNLISAQSNFCIYCCSPDRRRANFTVDHFLNKASPAHKNFIFEPLNLLAACNTCNLREKGTQQTATRVDLNYRQCDFLVFHPLIHDLEDHFDVFGEFNNVIIPNSLLAKRFFSMFNLWEIYDLIFENLERRNRQLNTVNEQIIEEVLSKAYSR